MKKVITIIGVTAIVVLIWQLVELDYQRDKLADKVQLQEKQIQALVTLVTETEKEKNASQKKLEDLIAELKNWAENNLSALSARQYSTITNCNPNATGRIHCFSY